MLFVAPIRNRLNVCLREASLLHSKLTMSTKAAATGSNFVQPPLVLNIWKSGGRAMYEDGERNAQEIAKLYVEGARALCERALAAGLKAMSLSVSYAKNTKKERRKEGRSATDNQPLASKVHGLVGARIEKSPMLQVPCSMRSCFGSTLQPISVLVADFALTASVCQFYLRLSDSGVVQGAAALNGPGGGSAWLAHRIESLVQEELHKLAQEYLTRGLVVLLNFSGTEEPPG